MFQSHSKKRVTVKLVMMSEVCNMNEIGDGRNWGFGGLINNDSLLALIG